VAPPATIAFEMARQLHRTGRSVEVLALIDADINHHSPALSLVHRFARMFRRSAVVPTNTSRTTLFPECCTRASSGRRRSARRSRV
jgi:thioesterase domain-containing protein